VKFLGRAGLTRGDLEDGLVRDDLKLQKSWCNLFELFATPYLQFRQTFSKFSYKPLKKPVRNNMQAIWRRKLYSSVRTWKSGRLATSRRIIIWANLAPIASSRGAESWARANGYTHGGYKTIRGCLFAVAVFNGHAMPVELIVWGIDS
jgi:hypothetical protein